jgi:hypothetical protein
MHRQEHTEEDEGEEKGALFLSTTWGSFSLQTARPPLLHLFRPTPLFTNPPLAPSITRAVDFHDVDSGPFFSSVQNPFQNIEHFLPLAGHGHQLAKA